MYTDIMLKLGRALDNKTINVKNVMVAQINSVRIQFIIEDPIIFKYGMCENTRKL